MRFLEVVSNNKNAKGFVKVDMRGNRGYIAVNVEGMGDVAPAGEVFLYKSLEEKIRIGPIYLVFKDENHSAVECLRKMERTKIVKPISKEIAECKREEPCNDNCLQEKENVELKREETCNNNCLPEKENGCKPEKEQKCQPDNNCKDNIKDINNPNKKLYSLLEEFERVEPLEQKICNLCWWKIQYDDGSIYKGFLPFFNQVISTYYPYPVFNHITTCQALMKKYDHYLFGIYKKDNEPSHFVYGVPGRFVREEQPYRGATGFKNWASKAKSNPGDYGYWICFVNAKTGSVTDAPKM